MSEILVLDASAVLAYLLNEQGALEVETAFDEARASGALLLIASVNWAEVLYNAARTMRYPDVASVVAFLDSLPLRLANADRRLSVTAAGFKNDRRLGLADAYAAALATLIGVPLMTADPDFDALEAEGLRLRKIS
jgi:PIN domain nuclease of toxin-antitoxin system